MDKFHSSKKHRKIQYNISNGPNNIYICRMFLFGLFDNYDIICGHRYYYYQSLRKFLYES